MIRFVRSVLIVLSASMCACAPLQQRQIVATDKAPTAIGPYSQAVRAGHFVFVSGQIPIDVNTKQMISGGIEDQTALVLDNVKAILAAAGMTMKNVVSTTVYLKNVDDFPKMNAVYAKYFAEGPPARATVEVSHIPRGALIEIAVTASD